jgi:1-acyl-sn-glycerol-3-phosphate acyltransferase
MFLRNFFARLLALWALASFVLSFLLIVLPSLLCGLIPNPTGQDWFIRIARGWMRVWLIGVGCPPTVKGREQFIPGESYIVICNHNSLMDPPMTSPFIPGPNKTIAKAVFAKVPLFGWYYKMGGVMVDRKNEISRRRSYEAMKNVLEGGMHMCIYPEGTRNRSNQPLKPFYDGAFKLSIETGHPILPAVLFNTRNILSPTRAFYFQPHPIELHFLKPIDPSGETVESLKEKSFRIISEYYTSHTR